MGLTESAKKFTLHLLKGHICSNCKYGIIHNSYQMREGRRVPGWTWCVTNNMDVDPSDSCKRYDRKERDTPPP
jgi:hypothetical protein